MQKLLLATIIGLSLLSTYFFVNNFNNDYNDTQELKAYENLIEFDIDTHVASWDLSGLDLDNYQIVAIGKSIERGRIQSTVGSQEIYGLVLTLNNNPFTDFSPVLSGIHIGLAENLSSLTLNIEDCTNMYWDLSFQDWTFPGKLTEFNFSSKNTDMSSSGYQTYLARVFSDSDNVLEGLNLNFYKNQASLYTFGSPLIENINSKGYDLSYIKLNVGQNTRSNYNLSQFQNNLVQLIENSPNVKTLELDLENDYITYDFLTNIESVMYPLIANGKLTNVILNVGDNNLDSTFVDQIFQDDMAIIKGTFVLNCD